MDIITVSFIIYLILFRLAIITTGIIAIVLGYRLFIKGIGWEMSNAGGTSVEAEVGANRFTLKNAAPGTCFALFGVIIIAIMFATGGPELTLNHLKNATMTSTDQEKSEPGSESWEIGLKGDITDSIKIAYKSGLFYERQRDTTNAIAAYEKALNLFPTDILNNLAWMYLFAGKIEESKPMVQLATQLEPNNANYLDTYAEFLYNVGNYEEGLRIIEKAAKLNSKFRNKIIKFRKKVYEQ